MLRRHKKWAMVVVIATVALIGGTAFAYWTQSGSGTGSATTGTTTAITVIQGSTVAGLYPGGPPGSLSGHFNNPGTSAVTITSVTAVVDPAFNSRSDATKPACTPSDFAIGGASGPYVVQPGTTTTWSGLTIGMVNGAGNQDNCKSVTPGINYTANP